MTLHWTHQAQLEYAWGGRYGRYNCNACTGGMIAEIDSKGAYLFTGAQVRAASNEPIPDGDSPGLNHTQAAASVFRLSKGKVELDVRNDYSFDSAKIRITDGAAAALSGRRSVLVERGQGHGNAFGGGHDIAVATIDDLLYLDDPLTGRFRTDWETLRRFCGQLVINAEGDVAGYGSAWAMFSRDMTTETPWWPDYAERPDPQATFAVRFDPGRYPRLDQYGNHVGWFYGGTSGFTAYGNSRWTHPGGHVLGKLITDKPGIWVDTTTAAHYWSKT